MAVFSTLFRRSLRAYLALLLMIWSATMSWANNGQVDFVTLDGKSRGSEDFLISTWSQSAYMRWSAANVTHFGDTDFALTLGETAQGDLEGAEVQSAAISDQGQWSWLAQAPDLDSGAVFAMFLYRADHNNDPWLEFDFEFLQGDTTSVQLAVHMEDAAGVHHSVSQTIDLGFDASAGMHLYEFDVTDTYTRFLVDNRIVWTADASVMPNGLWLTGEMKAFSSLWAAVTKPDWAGEWDYSGTPMVGEFNGWGTPDHALFSPTLEADYQTGREASTGLKAHDLDGDQNNNKIIGGRHADSLTGQDGMDVLFGAGGRDRLYGGDGDDVLDGGTGHDSLYGGAGNDLIMGGAHFDQLTGGAGADTFVFSGADISHDTIMDFSLSEGDILDASALGLTGADDFVFIRQTAGTYNLATAQGTEFAKIHTDDLSSDLTLDVLIAEGAFYF